MKKTPKTINFLLISIFSLVLSACNGGGNSQSSSEGFQSIVDVAEANSNLTTLMATLQATGLDQTLTNQEQDYTLFAPTDAAFDILGTEAINALLADTDKLTDILTYHVVTGRVDSTTAREFIGKAVLTTNGATAALSLDGNNLLVNTATIITTDILADNGIVHIIDAVLMPPAKKEQTTNNIMETAINSEGLSTMVTALQASGVDQTLTNPNDYITVFAPTDSAFGKLGQETLNALLADTDQLKDTLLQHAVRGDINSVMAYTFNGKSISTLSGKSVPVNINSTSDTLVVGGATVITKDIYASNGVIHLIDTVISAAE